MTDPFKPVETPAAALRNAKIGGRLQRIAQMIEKELAKAGAKRENTQFSLIIWGEGRMQYVSTGEREDTKTAMREMLNKWDTPGAEGGTPTFPLGGLTD